jgi:2',3'-cyclic-nucleotide 2'-phosphodiesterase (5'-nucleotidase family)
MGMSASIRRAWSVLLLIAACCLATPIRAQDATTATAAHADDRIHLVVLHTNDIHGQMLARKSTSSDKDHPPMIGGLPRIGACINAVRAEAKQTGAGVVVVDGGDWYQGTPEGQLDDGTGFIQCLVLVGYDALCIGNHDFDRGIANLARLIEVAKLPAVCANLEVKATSKLVDWVPAYRIVEVKGVKIGIVGIVTPATPEITHRDARTLDFVAPSKALARVKTELAGKVDWLLPITHLGVEDDRKLARSNPELALVVGGHSHTYLKEGVLEGSTRIVQAGSKAGAVGRVDLWLEPATHKVVESRASMIDLDREPAPEERNAALDARCKELEARTDERMSAIVGELDAPLLRTKDPLASGSAGNAIADSVRERARADVGLMNRGGIRCDLEAGKVTRRGVFELVPFDNNVTVLALSGAELFEMIRRSVEGTAHSGLEWSGLVAEVTVETGSKRKLSAVKIGDTDLDPKATYRVAMNSFMADGGDAYLERKEGSTRVDEPIFVRDVLEQWFVAHGKVKPDATNRYVVKKP